jgi:hypothetical protein
LRHQRQYPNREAVGVRAITTEEIRSAVLEAEKKLGVAGKLVLGLAFTVETDFPSPDSESGFNSPESPDSESGLQSQRNLT